MPKVKKEKIEPSTQPYNINSVKKILKTWKVDAKDYESKTSTHFDLIRGYISKHMGKMSSTEVVDLYDSVSKALDVIGLVVKYYYEEIFIFL